MSVLTPNIPKATASPEQTHADYESEEKKQADAGNMEAAKLEEVRVEDLLRSHLQLSEASQPQPKAGQKRKLTKKKGHEFFRTKSQRVAYELENALQGGDRSGPGLKRYQLPAQSSGAPALEQPVLIVSGDQGPDIWCFQNWADSSNGRLCMLREPDVWNHGLMNDCVGAAVDCGAGSFLFAATVVMNLHFMPWRDGRYGRMIEDTAQELRSRHDHREQTFQFYIREIAREKGLLHELCKGESAETEIWHAFLDSKTFWLYQQKIGMCRWGQVFRRLQSFASDWTSFLALLTRMCISDFFSTLLKDLKASGVALSGNSQFERTTKGSSAEEIKQLRSACKNALCFAYHFLSVSKHKSMAIALGLCSQRFWEHYTEQGQSLTSGAGGREWGLRQLQGQFWQPFQRSVQFLGSAALLEKLEISVEGSSSATDPAAEEVRLSFAARFVFAMVRRRFVRCVFFILGWPYRGALWLDPAKQDEAVQDFKQHLDAFEEAGKSNSTFYAGICERSPLRLPVVQMFAAALKRNNWKLTPEISEKMRRLCSGFKQSRLVERSFNVGRRQENAAANKETTEESFMWQLLEKRVLTKVFKYISLEPSNLP